jgi:hypothetical protein
VRVTHAPSSPPFPRARGVRIGVALILAPYVLYAAFLVLWIGHEHWRGDPDFARGATLSLRNTLLVLVPLLLVGRGLSKRRRWARIPGVMLCVASTLGWGVLGISVWFFSWPPRLEVAEETFVPFALTWLAIGSGRRTMDRRTGALTAARC